MTFKHLTKDEIYQIHTLMKAGQDQSETAKLLQVNNNPGFGQ
jgi:hypothetical protein